MTPQAVHTGQAGTIRDQRVAVLQAAYAAYPERFVHGEPVPPLFPKTVWINPPTLETIPAAEVRRH